MLVFRPAQNINIYLLGVPVPQRAWVWVFHAPGSDRHPGSDLYICPSPPTKTRPPSRRNAVKGTVSSRPNRRHGRTGGLPRPRLHFAAKAVKFLLETEIRPFLSSCPQSGRPGSTAGLGLGLARSRTGPTPWIRFIYMPIPANENSTTFTAKCSQGHGVLSSKPPPR